MPPSGAQEGGGKNGKYQGFDGTLNSDLFSQPVSYNAFFQVLNRRLYAFCPGFIAVLTGRGRVAVVLTLS